jgi:hypothetical protein
LIDHVVVLGHAQHRHGERHNSSQWTIGAKCVIQIGEGGQHNEDHCGFESVLEIGSQRVSFVDRVHLLKAEVFKFVLSVLDAEVPEERFDLLFGYAFFYLCEGLRFFLYFFVDVFLYLHFHIAFLVFNLSGDSL